MSPHGSRQLRCIIYTATRPVTLMMHPAHACIPFCCSADKASAWAASHTLLLTAIFLGFFNFKCLIVVVVTLWRQARQSRVSSCV